MPCLHKVEMRFLEMYRIEQHVGELIRQTRRQRNLTQTELGGDRYSKSYISAVERGKIMPSGEALKFFAEQLDQQGDFFTALSRQAESMRQLAVLSGSGTLNSVDQALQDEELSFLDMVLEGADLHDFEARQELKTLSPEMVATLSHQKQTRYYMLAGMIAQKRQEYPAAWRAFERALALAPAKYQSAILDELGYTYYLMHAYHIALSYHLRALDLLRSETTNNAVTPLLFKVELHCGDDYLAFGAYKEACDFYELARSHLNAERDMKTAGLLYLSLGYCTYALIFQTKARAALENKQVTPEEIEVQFQRAIGFLVQSRSVCQVSYDRMGEAKARLALALTELDLSTQRRRLAQESVQREGKQFAANYASFLDDAEEQCRQVLLILQDRSALSDTPITSLDAAIYLALAYLIRVFTQRAMLARLSGYGDTSSREGAIASSIYQQVVDTLNENSCPLPITHKVLYLQAESIAHRPPTLPGLPNVGDNAKNIQCSPISLIEIYLAAGELVEELGRAAGSPDYAFDCYTRANQFFQAALNLAYLVVSMGDREPGYLVYCYWRCICLLEERSTAPDLWKETDRTMVNLFKNGLYRLHDAILSAQVGS